MEQHFRKNARDILERYVKGACTEAESRWVEQWYESQRTEPFALAEVIAEADLAEVFDRLEGTRKKQRMRRIRRSVAIAASILLPAVAIGVYFLAPFPKASTTQLADTGTLQPGGNRATLVLEDGRTIDLDSMANGMLAEQNGIRVIKSADGMVTYQSVQENSQTSTAYHTITTPCGGQYQIVLPDGSKVWLNAASSLRYPSHFTEGERRVQLTGEGYFSVARDISRPFHVQAVGQDITVLGTEFNVNAYTDEPAAATTLISGSIALKAEDNNGTVLQPGQQAVYQNGLIQVRQVESEEFIAWKNGKFMFNDTDIRTIMRQLARWYDAEVVYEGDLGGITFTGSVSRADDIQDVLRKIALTQSVRFTTTGRRIMVSR